MALLAFVLVNFLAVQASFTPHFRKFLNDNYGATVVSNLERKDLGADASVGGKLDDDDRPPTQPVIIVHGMGDTIAHFGRMFDYLKKQGYSSNSIYGSTWGDGGKTPAGLVAMKALIVAVADYTDSQVDILAYSMGSPLTRKAILGGECVDTKESLGPPLTELVDTYVSVAGSNYGSARCAVPMVGTCNRINGLNCESAYIKDINKEREYEGSFRFSIFSTTDNMLGFRSCGRPVSPLLGGTGFVMKKGLNHKQVMERTKKIQYNFISKHVPV